MGTSNKTGAWLRICRDTWDPAVVLLEVLSHLTSRSGPRTAPNGNGELRFRHRADEDFPDVVWRLQSDVERRSRKCTNDQRSPAERLVSGRLLTGAMEVLDRPTGPGSMMSSSFGFRHSAFLRTWVFRASTFIPPTVCRRIALGHLETKCQLSLNF